MSHLDQYAPPRYRRQRGVATAFSLIAILAASCATPGSVESTPPRPTPPTQESPTSTSPIPPWSAPPSTSLPAGAVDEVRLREVVDGDTIRVDVTGGTETVRLIGMNTPESGECLAAEATRRLADLLGPAEVTMQADVSDRDRYGRLLRYVYADGVLVNEVLVAEGLAVARRYEPDTFFDDRLGAAQERARAAGVGMWAPDACGAPTLARVVVEEISADPPGDDTVDLNAEWVRLANTGDGNIDLTGWVVKDESATHRFAFPDGFVLPAGGSVTIRSGCGADSSRELHWCVSGSAVWNNAGDTVFVLDPAGNIVVARSY